MSEDDGDRRFISIKLDDDRFVRTGRQIIDAAEFEMGYEARKTNLADLYVDYRRRERWLQFGRRNWTRTGRST